MWLGNSSFFLASGKEDAYSTFSKMSVGFTHKASSGPKLWKSFPFVNVEVRL